MGSIPPHGWTWQLQNRLAKMSSDQWHVHNAGVGGNTTALGLDRFMQDVNPWLPATVLIEFGINDCYIFEHAQIARVSVDEYVRKANGMPVLIANHTMTSQGGHSQGNAQTVQSNIQPYQQALRHHAAQWGVLVIDLPARMEIRQVNLLSFLAVDGVHLSERGQAVYAAMVFEAINDLNLLGSANLC
jgi:lysophospholipase L1-like esterase